MIDFTFSKESLEKWKTELQPEQFWELIFMHLKIKKKSEFSWHLAIDYAPQPVLEELNVHRRKFWTGLSAILRAYCGPFCAFNESGTIAPTSDIDITMVYSKALNLLKFVNDIIQKLYGKDLTMEKLFDMNIYVHTWYMMCDPSGPTPIIMEDCNSRNKILNESTLNRQELHELNQELTSWKRRKNPLFKAIEIMENFQSSMTQEVYDATSRVAYFEQDAFYSVGAYLHVVVRLQQERHIKLLPVFYKMSFCDNLGFLLLALETAPNSGKIMKYLYRCLDAIRQLTKNSRLKYHKEYQMLLDYQKAKTMGDMQKKNAIMEKWINHNIDIIAMLKHLLPYAV